MCKYTKVIFQETGIKHGKTRRFAATSCFPGLRYALDTEILSNAILNERFPPKVALAAGDAGKRGLGFCGRDVNFMADSREVMNIRQASQYLGVSPDTLYKYVNEQKIPAFKLGNRWRFKKSKLDQWMEEKSNQMEVRTKRKPQPKAAVKAAGSQ